MLEGFDKVRTAGMTPRVSLIVGMSTSYTPSDASARCGAFLDAEVFGEKLTHACSARVALNMIANAMHERGVAAEDRQAIRAINVEAAAKMGVLPRSFIHRANGHARPR